MSSTNDRICGNNSAYKDYPSIKDAVKWYCSSRTTDYASKVTQGVNKLNQEIKNKDSRIAKLSKELTETNKTYSELRKEYDQNLLKVNNLTQEYDELKKISEERKELADRVQPLTNALKTRKLFIDKLKIKNENLAYMIDQLFKRSKAINSAIASAFMRSTVGSSN